MSSATSPSIPSTPPCPLTIDEVVKAFRTLHGSGSREEKKEADLGLRRWQLSFEAWSISDQLLSTPTCPYEIQHMAALTLKTKIMYDVVQLPPNSLESLCSSLLGHIRRFKSCQPRTLLVALGLAFADLTIHMASFWKSFIDALCENLNEPQDAKALLLCLKQLPEENHNYSVLADPSARSSHAGVLRSNLHAVVRKLNSIIEVDPDAETTAKVFECFIEWVTFSESADQENRDDASSAATQRQQTESQSLLSGTFIELCIKLLKSPNPSTDDSVADCLTMALQVACRSPVHHQELLQRMLREVSSTDGIIRALLALAFQKDNANAVLRLARLYRFTGIGSAEHIARSLHKDLACKELLPIMIRLTSVPFDLDDDARTLNGIASQMFDFWEALAVAAARIRSGSTTGWKPGGHGKAAGASPVLLPPGIADALEFGQLIEQQNGLFEVVLTTLLGQCLLPVGVIADASVDDYDYYQFRYDACCCINRVAQLVGLDAVLIKMIQLLESSQALLDRRTQEGYITAICRLVKYLDVEDETVDQFSSSSPASSINVPFMQSSEAVTRLFDLLSLYSGSLLLVDPPMDLLDCYTRVALAQLISKTASRHPLKDRPELIPKLLESLGHQVFQVDLIKTFSHPATHSSRGPQDHFDPSSSSSSTESPLVRARRDLSEKAADAFRALCVSGQDSLMIQALVPSLLTALRRFDGIAGHSYYPILEGIAILVSAIKDDMEFLKASEDLFNPVVSTLVSTSCPDEGVIIGQADRIAILLRSLTPEGEAPLRRQALGSFLTTKLWPILEHLLRVHADSETRTEKCCRVLKHGMRCVKAEAFKPIVPPLVALLTHNATTVKPQATYLYVAEWLIVEYQNDQQITKVLKLLFNELSALALRKIQACITTDESAEQCSLIVEDLYGMFCRYLRFCPTIPATSPSLEIALELGYSCMHVPSRGSPSMVCSFLGNMAYVLRTFEVEEGDLDPETIRQSCKNVERLFYSHLQRIVCELFKVIESIPSTTTMDAIANALLEIRSASRKEEFESAIRRALVGLPAAVLATENYKEKIVQVLVHDRCIEDLLEELFTRCRQVNLRQHEAELIATQ